MMQFDLIVEDSRDVQTPSLVLHTPSNHLPTNVPLEHECCAFKDIRGPAMTTIIHDCGHMRKQTLIHLNQVERASIVVTDSIRTDEKLQLNLEPLGLGRDTNRGYWRANTCR